MLFRGNCNIVPKIGELAYFWIITICPAYEITMPPRSRNKLQLLFPKQIESSYKQLKMKPLINLSERCYIES